MSPKQFVRDDLQAAHEFYKNDLTTFHNSPSNGDIDSSERIREIYYGLLSTATHLVKTFDDCISWWRPRTEGESTLNFVIYSPRQVVTFQLESDNKMKVNVTEFPRINNLSLESSTSIDLGTYTLDYPQAIVEFEDGTVLDSSECSNPATFVEFFQRRLLAQP